MIVAPNYNFTGTHGQLAVVSRAELVTRRRHYPGIDGESEIRAGINGRMWRCDYLVANNYASLNQLNIELVKLEGTLLGMHGVVTALYGQAAGGGPQDQQTLFDTTYMGFERDPNLPEARLDVAGTIDGGWWIRGFLNFYELKVQ